jgi:hypothetical protein
MSRKSDEELLEEIKAQRKLKKAEEEEEEENANADDETSSEETSPKVATQIVEREITLSLLNDKLNFIISKVQNIK